MDVTVGEFVYEVELRTDLPYCCEWAECPRRAKFEVTRRMSGDEWVSLWVRAVFCAGHVADALTKHAVWDEYALDDDEPVEELA